MTLKVIQVGNSAGIIIPQVMRTDNDINIGDTIEVHITKIKKLRRKKAPISTKFAQMVDEFMTEHADVLQELAKK